MTLIKICGDYEKDETALVEREVKKGDTVIDLGANKGHFTIIMAELVGKEGKVFAFEPDPDTFGVLKDNVKNCGYDNVILVQKAVSNTNDRRSLYRCAVDYRNNSLTEGCLYENNPKCIDVDTVRLDDYFNGYNINKENKEIINNIDFIKMDIQGGETVALQGMIKTIEKSNNLKMLIEIWPWGLTKAGTSKEEFLDLLMKHKLQLYHLNGNRMDVFPKLQFGSDCLDVFVKKYNE